MAKQKHSSEARDPHDWYVEPEWCTEVLLDHIGPLTGYVVDPCCGQGNILKVVGDKASGFDIVDRGAPRLIIEQDFRDSEMRCDNIISNPPYSLAQEFIEHFLPTTGRILAVLNRLDFLASQGRNAMFNKNPPWRVIVLSKRPSMPPGGRDILGKQGMHDYCWIVWNKIATGRTQMIWAMP